VGWADIQRKEKEKKQQSFRIKYLVTSIQFLDCNSTTMLFNHSQFGLGVRDWIFHSLVVKKKKSQKKQLGNFREMLHVLPSTYSLYSNENHH
jgi:hypothetical protein